MSMMLTFRAGKLAALMVSVAMLGACSREQQDWRSAEASDTVAGYSDFLHRHPDSELATEARTRVAQLSEDKEWQTVSAADTADAYKQFLAQHPNGKWAQEARIRMENFALGRERATASASTSATVAASGAAAGAPIAQLASSAPVSSGELARPQAIAQTLPNATTSGPTSTTPSPSGSAPPSPAIAAAWRSDDGFGVQLGAFASENAATTEWQQLTARFAAQLRGLSPRVVSANTATGRLFRLQALVADEAAARTLCDMLKKQSQACVPVLPH
jgi:cell division septation protein DedD